MTLTAALAVAVGAAFGAPLRYLADRWIGARHDGVFPWGTLTVNVVASFGLGVVLAASSDGALSDRSVTLLGTGFCGALSTYSTFGYETSRLLEGGARRYAVLNVAVSVGAGLAAATAGWLVAG